MLLAGDVGGTKTRLAIFSAERGARDPLCENTLPSGRYDSLESLVADFLKQVDQTVESACFGVAGPVVAGRSTITNLPWMMDERHLADELGLARVVLLNDLVATANAVPHLQPDDLHTLHPGQPVEEGVIAVIAPGTGLGEAYLTWDGSHYRPHSSEGGHTDFGPTDELEAEMLDYLMKRFGHVSYERVASGKGLPNIYAFLRDCGKADEPDWLARELAKAEDPTPVIMQAGLEGRAEICRWALDIFLSILGAETGNLALKVLSTGGIYLGGGIPPRILPLLDDGRFMTAFLDKGRFVALLRTMPIHVILHPAVALYGAARYGLDMVA